MLLERHHPRAHEIILQLGGGARLLHQDRFCIASYILQQILDATDVAGGFRQPAGELLNGGVTSQFERVEFLITGRLCLMPEKNLGLGFYLEQPQLLLQPLNGLSQFDKVELDRTELLIET